MKKIVLFLFFICFTLVGCTSTDATSFSDIEQVVEYLNSSDANYYIKTISDGCCQYEGSVDGDIITRYKTHYNYDEDGNTTSTNFTTYFYDVKDSTNYTLYTSNTTSSLDSDYKSSSTWSTDEKTGSAPYLLSFDLCACCSTEDSNVFTFDLESENNDVYKKVVVDLSNGIDKVVVTVTTLTNAVYEITSFNTINLTLPCLDDCSE